MDSLATYILSLYYPTSSGDSSFLGPPSFVVPHFRSTTPPSLQLSLTQAPFSPFASSTLRRLSTTMTLRRSFLDYDFASVNLFLHTPHSPNPCTAGWSLDLYPLSQGLRTTRLLKLGWSLGISPGEGVYFVSLTEHRHVVVLGGGKLCGHLVNSKFFFFLPD
jgi:hypothetical protein